VIAPMTDPAGEPGQATQLAGSTDQDDRDYEVVINDEQQYSIWLSELPRPAGWRPVGPSGSMSSCLEYIGQAWTDSRPRSVRGR
jgi:MbtH protein